MNRPVPTQLYTFTNMETDASRNNTNDTDSGEEEIILEFPTELIPDEYEHENGTSGLVYVFRDNEDIANMLVEAFKAHDFKIPKENKFNMAQKDEILGKLKELGNKDYTEKTCLIVAVIGKNEVFKDLYHVSSQIWSPFIDNKTLKYKPKIFIFYEYKEETLYETDSLSGFRSQMAEQPYDVPSEADVLIIYQKSTDIIFKKNKYGYLMGFCENLKKFGERDDIISILTRTNHKNKPLIISTLRKKFYVSSSSFREHYFDFESNSVEITEILNSLRKHLKKPGPRRTFSRTVAAVMQKSESAKVEKKESSKLVVDGPSKRRVSTSSNISVKSKKETKNNEPKKTWKF